MKKSRSKRTRLLLLGLIACNGCGSLPNKYKLNDRSQFCSAPAHSPTCGVSQLQLSEPCINQVCDLGTGEPVSPLDLDESLLTSANVLNFSLDDCIQQALSTSKIMRDLGLTVIRSPQSVTTTLDPALVFTDPGSGEEAALSLFDANLFASSLFEANNRKFNNQFFGVNGNYNQSLNTSQVGISKRSATGGLYTIRNVTLADNNNQSGNRLGRQSWETFFEVEVKHPLLQGAGTEFNRIAGPGSSPGQLNGVLIARTRTDISLVDFERSVRDLVAEVENAYWDLYFAYRDLEAKIDLRDIAEETLAKRVAKADAGDASKSDIAQAKEQVLRFQADIVDAINGRPIDGTRTNNGASGGVFRGNGGVRIAERKLRLMIGSAINDGQLIRPSDSPSSVPVIFDWPNAIANALTRREELRRQRWVIKQAELELIANRNFLRPQLDVVTRYRARGFGKELFKSNPDGKAFFDNNLQEWNAGLEYTLPVGFRRAYAAVRNSELALARANEVLREQERGVHMGLSNALAESKRSYENAILQKLRLDAIVEQLNAMKAREDSANTPALDVVLETHRRLLDSRLRYHQAQIEYAISLRNVHFEKGTLLSYHNVHLSESEFNGSASLDATELLSYQDASVQSLGKDPIIAQ
jgi:outer membrane protein TolC